MVQTKADLPDAPDELSLYAPEGYWEGTYVSVRRYALRVDGFVALHAGYAGGAARTVPLVFTGRRLVLNCATSAVGSVRVELQDAGGAALPGFALADAPEIWGDEIERPVRWHGGDDVSALAGHPVRLRLVLKDADVFAFRFVN